MKELLDMNRIPQHIAIIMDGNGRWAMDRGLDRTFGHKAGVDTVKKITAECARLGVKFLTLYTFSTENWNRPAYEIEALMGLVLSFVEMDLFTDNNIRFRMIGDRKRLPDSVQEKIKYMEDLTKDNTRMTVVMAMSYSSRWEITNAVRQIVAEVRDKLDHPNDMLRWKEYLTTGGIFPQDITEDTISQHLCTNFMPDPELLIRTGGELRISNYLLWQCAYTEFYFTPVAWPDFNKDELLKAVEAYAGRTRKFGGLKT